MMTNNTIMTSTTRIHKYQVLKKLKMAAPAVLLTIAAVAPESPVVAVLPSAVMFNESESVPFGELAVAVMVAGWVMPDCTAPENVTVFTVWALIVPRLIPVPMFPAEVIESIAKLPVYVTVEGRAIWAVTLFIGAPELFFTKTVKSRVSLVATLTVFCQALVAPDFLANIKTAGPEV